MEYAVLVSSYSVSWKFILNKSRQHRDISMELSYYGNFHTHCASI